MGFVSAEAAAGICLMFFVWAGSLISGDSGFPSGFSLSLSLMMTFSSFLLYACLLFCRVRFFDKQEQKPLRFNALFLTGSALAAVCSMILAFVTDWSGAASLVMICYMIICELIVILAFFVVIFLVKWLLKLIGKESGFLNELKWQLILSLSFFAVIFMLLLMF